MNVRRAFFVIAASVCVPTAAAQAPRSPTPAAFTMGVVDEPDAVPEPVADFALVFTDHSLGDCEIGRLERDAFYEAAHAAFAVVQTGELRPYGNILLVKGVVNRFEFS